MKDLHIDPLYRFLKTHRDANDLVGILTGLHTKVFDEDISPLDALFKELPYEMAEAVQSIAKDAEVNLQDKMMANKYFQQLEEAISKIPVMSINFANHPTIAMLDKIKNWFQINCKSQVLLEIHVDPHIIAGIQLYYNGQYKDYSLRKQLGHYEQNVQNLKG